MSRNRRFRPAMGSILPMACVALAWPAVWAFWPIFPSEPVGSGWSETETTFVFSSPSAGESSPWSPTLIVLPPWRGHDALTNETGNGGSVCPVRMDLSVPLGRWSSGDGHGGGVLPRTDKAPSAARERYVPLESDPPTYRLSVSGMPVEVGVEVSREFGAHQFEIADLTADTFPKTEKPWIVKADVETDRRGLVRHVFLQARSDLPDVNDAVVRALRRGRVKQDRGECEGVVCVSWPGKRAQKTDEK